MPKAQDEFRQRDNMDGRQLSTWYHIDDITRIQSLLFKDLPENTQKQTMIPFVFFDDDQPPPLENIMAICIDYFMQSDKSYFPFIFKPEIGCAHYMAGIFRKIEGKVSLIIFNPVGGASRLQFGDQFGDDENDIELIISPHQIQTIEKEVDGVLVSCGPLCIYFIDFALRNLAWLNGLNKNFILPKKFNRHLNDKKSYQETIMNLRLAHDALLEGIPDIDLEQIANIPEHIVFRDFFIKKIDELQDSSSEYHYSVDEQDEQANAELNQANAERDQANAERDQANAERNQANAERDQVNAERNQANAERDQANAERNQANAERNQANADFDELNANLNEQLINLQANLNEVQIKIQQQKAANQLNGLTLNLLGGFAAVIGVTAVALAIAALMIIGSAGLIPAIVVGVTGISLATLGLFSFHQRMNKAEAQQPIHNPMQIQPAPGY